VAMRVAYTEQYPETPPELSVRAVRRGGLSDTMIAELESLLREAAASEELLGTPMVYGLGEKAQEWLLEHNQPEMDMHQEMMARLAAQQAASSAAVDVSDDAGTSGEGGLRTKAKQKQHGSKEAEGTWRADPLSQALTGNFTPVTPESFMAWRKDFEARQAAAAAAAVGGKGGIGSSQNKKAAGEDSLNGRQLFERSGGAALLESDAGALDEGEEDMMSLPRVAADDAATVDDEAQLADVIDPAGSSALLDTVGDEALFDEDEDLPDED